MKNNNNTPLVQSFAATDQGRRPNNEDTVAFFEPTDPKERQQSGCIYIVADGVGGASVGERASKFAAEKVLYEYLKHPEVEPATRLKQAIVKANREIYAYAEQNGIRMATTMTIAAIFESKLIAANVGDSRVYLIRAGEAKQITHDHNVVGELVRNGAMTEAEALKSKAKNKLTRSIGGSDEVQADTFDVPLQPNDRILLCSDGLTRYALKADIAKLSASGSPKQVATAAIDFAKKMGNGGADNISVISVAYEPIEMTVPPKPEEWESRDTELDRKPVKPTPQIPYLPIAILAGLLLLFFVAAGTVAFLNREWLFGLFASASATPTVTLTGAPATATPSFTMEPTATTPTVQETPTIDTSLPTPETAVPLTASVIKNCSQFIRVRSFPSTEDAIAPVVGKLACGETLVLTGKFVDEKGAKWLQIQFRDTGGTEILAWVHASLVDLSEEVDGLLPRIIVNMPTPIVPTLGLQIEGKVQCQYVVADGDGLISIAKKFGIEDPKPIYCAPENTAACTLNPEDPNSIISVGWILIIPNIDSATCTTNGGTVQP